MAIILGAPGVDDDISICTVKDKSVYASALVLIIFRFLVPDSLYGSFVT